MYCKGAAKTVFYLYLYLDTVYTENLKQCVHYVFA